MNLREGHSVLTKNIKSILRSCIRFCVLITDSFCFDRAKVVHEGSGVAFVRTDAIGDFIIWLREAASLRAAFPGEQLTLFCNSAVEDLAKRTGYWDEVIGIKLEDLVKVSTRYKVILNLKKYRFTAIYHPVSSRVLLVGDSIVKSLNAELKVGISGDYTNSSWFEHRVSDSWYNRLYPRNIESEIEFNSYFSSCIGARTLKSEIPLFSAQMIRDGSSPSSNKYVVVCLGASFFGKIWSLDQFAKVIDWILSNTSCDIVFVGAKNERYLVEDLVLTSSNVKGRCRNLVGDNSLVETFSLISNADLVLGNDSAVVHIAALLHVPAVCIAGGGHFGRFIPYPPTVYGPVIINEYMYCYNCNWSCVNPDYIKGQCFPCVRSVSSEKVIFEVQQILRDRL